MSNGSSTMMKLMLIGDSAVGKTSILGRFSDDKFDISHITTIGIDFKTKEIELRGQKVKLQVWDTAGQERFQTITHQYYRGAMGIVLVYDITNGKSFSNIERWLRKIEEHASENVVKVIVGNKSDRTDKRVVSRERGETMAMEHGVCFYETSAKLNENIDKVFFELAETILAESETNAVDEPNRETVVPGEMSNSLQERIGGRCCY